MIERLRVEPYSSYLESYRKVGQVYPVTIANGQEAILRVVGPGDPWVEVLRGYGRNPDWSPPLGGD